MAKLQIKGKSLVPRDLEITLDGVRITSLRELHLTLEHNNVNTCTISFYPDDIDVDAEVLAELELRRMKAKQREAVNLP